MRPTSRGVAAQEVGFPRTHQKVFQRGEADLLENQLAVERLRHRPAGIDPAHGAQAADRVGREMIALPSRIAGQGGADTFEEDLVMNRGLGRAANGADPLDPVGVDGTPVQCLLRPHRPAVDERQGLDAEDLAEQPALGFDIVPMGEERIAIAAEGGARLLGELERPLVNILGMTMNHSVGSRTRPGPINHSVSPCWAP